MARTTRRHFLQQTAFAAAAIPAGSMYALAEAGSTSPFDEPSPSPLPAAAIQKLASNISGRVITASEPDYESARLVFNRAFDRHPALIVRCAGADDVVRALDFAQAQNVPVAVRGGGHSRAGFSVCDGGVVIDLSAMKRIEVDKQKRVARAEAGSLVRDLDQAMQPFGLATTMGGCPNVGIAGFTLGGGEGVLMSMFGAACDNLLSAHIVTVDGRQLEVSRDSNPDLFWAIRGGGGNFGIATAFEYRLHPIGEVLSGTLTYSTQHLPELLHVFGKFALEAPDEMNLFGEILPSTDGPRFLIHVFYGDDPRRGNQLLAPLRTPIKPLEENLRSVSYFESQAAGFVPRPFAHFQTNVIIPDFNGGASEAIAAAIHAAPPQFRVLIVVLSGAITRVPLTDMAFPLRHPGFEIDMLGTWTTPADKPADVQWVKALRDKLQPLALGAYGNQLGETSDQLAMAAYGPNYARLRDIKKKYDPTNVLRINQNIKPA